MSAAFVNSAIDRTKYKATTPSKYPFASKTICSEEEIRARIEVLAAAIAADYKHKVSKANPLVLLCVLKGSYLFTADLARALFRHGTYTTVEFIYVNSYHGGTASTGQVSLLLDTRAPVAGKHVMFIEDILDTARTLSFLVKLFEDRKAASTAVCVLLDKPEGRVMPFEAQYVGFTIAKEFVIGYGLDFGSEEIYRDIPDVVVLKPSEYMTTPPVESNL